MEALPLWPEKSARVGARPHTRSTPRHSRASLPATISPSGSAPLNAWDSANYAVCADVFAEAYTWGLGQMLLRPMFPSHGGRSRGRRCPWGNTARMPRGQATARQPSVSRGGHVQGATRAERKARHRSRPRGNQQCGTRAQSQRPRRPTRVDASVRQDVGRPVGVQGHGAAGRRPASHRRGHRAEARPPRAAARDRARRRRSRTRGGPGLPARRGRRGQVGHRALPPRSGARAAASGSPSQAPSR